MQAWVGAGQEVEQLKQHLSCCRSGQVPNQPAHSSCPANSAAIRRSVCVCVCDGRITPTQSIDSTRSQFVATRISCLLGLQLELELGLTACVSYEPSILANKAETNLLAVPGLNLHKWPEWRLAWCSIGLLQFPGRDPWRDPILP